MPSDTEQLSALVRAQIEELLGDPVRRAELLGVQPFGPDQADMLDYHDSVIRSLLADRSLGRALNGPLWLSGASVVDGTVTASKLIVNTLESITINTGSLNVTGTIVAATSFPATGSRVEIGSAGLWGYNGPSSTTFRLNTDGSGSIGIGTTAMTWNTSGVVSIPKAAIGTLTIADIGGGVLGGTYQTSTGTSRIDISTSGIVAYSGGTETFRLNATTGAMTATGSFTIQSALSGTRVVISNAGGIEGYNASGRTFRINASTGDGFIGPESSARRIEWDSSGVKIGGVYLDSSTGKITASSLSVTSLSAISADLGTITAGTISGGTITASAITTGTLNFGSGGTVNTTGTVTGTFGGLNLANLTVTGNITLGSGGKIIDADGSEWNSSGLILKSAGVFGDAIKWNHGGSDVGSITGSTSGMYMYQGSSGFGTSHLFLSSSAARLQHGSSGYFLSVTGAGIQTGGPIYPGTTGLIQSDNSLSYVNEGIAIVLGDAGGTYTWDVRNSNGTRVFGVSSNGSLFRAIANDATALGSYFGRVPIYINGSLKYLAVYN
ncbi:MAG: hypothetical protein KatS3mg064_0587 [Tepidiforma sp.]|nr:hypothetical protein [Tepidiforma sp.]GIW17430.1 MAG: hypothetical protein KatS3mg064_0587 [Tepidiforma sp.]